MTVYELENQVGRGSYMTAAEYRQWLNFYREEPWGCEVDDVRFTTLASVTKCSTAGGKPFTPDQLFPWTRENYARENDRTEEEELRLAAEQAKIIFMKVDARERIKEARQA